MYPSKKKHLSNCQILSCSFNKTQLLKKLFISILLHRPKISHSWRFKNVFIISKIVWCFVDYWLLITFQNTINHSRSTQTKALPRLSLPKSKFYYLIINFVTNNLFITKKLESLKKVVGKLFKPPQRYQAIQNSC